MDIRNRIGRLGRTFCSERRRREFVEGRDRTLDRQRMAMVLLTVGNTIDGGVVLGDGPYGGIDEAEVVTAFTGVSYMDAIKRLEKLRKGEL